MQTQTNKQEQLSPFAQLVHQRPSLRNNSRLRCLSKLKVCDNSERDKSSFPVSGQNLQPVQIAPIFFAVSLRHQNSHRQVSGHQAHLCLWHRDEARRSNGLGGVKCLQTLRVRLNSEAPRLNAGAELHFYCVFL